MIIVVHRTINMSVSSQVFLLFYAVIYGVLFTISDRWRPFFTHHRSKESWYRFILSLLFFGILPVGYFLFVFPPLLYVTGTSTLQIAISAYAVAPIISFYFIWIWIVLWQKDTFYTDIEQNTEPLKTSLTWLGRDSVSLLGICIGVILFLLVPVFLLLLLLVF